MREFIIGINEAGQRLDKYLKMRIVFLSAKVSVFQQDQITITVSHPKGLTWHFIETKAMKHDYYSSLIM